MRNLGIIAVVLGLMAAAGWLSAGDLTSQTDQRVQDNNEGSMTDNQTDDVKLEKATFGGGCFWGVEEFFRQIEGVSSTAAGYMGGGVAEPTYQEVCSDATGHAEVVQLEFDPDVISYEKLLGFFWRIHDPTTLNRQGPDVGSQYRSAIFFHSSAQEETARRSLREEDSSLNHLGPIVTKIEPAEEFYEAEEYHQRYLQKRGLPGCGLH